MDLLKRILAWFRALRSKESDTGKRRRNKRSFSEIPTESAPSQLEHQETFRSNDTPSIGPRPNIGPQRDPFFIQIGLDFGTSYCKVVCRDIIRDMAWVHIPETPAVAERPFLLPSALWSDGTTLSLGPGSAHYHERGLPHVKIALAKVATGELDDPFVAPFFQLLRDASAENGQKMVSICATYLLGGILADVRRSIRNRIPDFGEHPDDYEAVSLAVPVADAEKPEVSTLFHRVLVQAFQCSGRLVDFPKVSISKFAAFINHVGPKAADQDEFRFFVYPEVSAGVQGFVRSRVAKDGLYVFSETGAATVDQSVFILFRPRHEEARLTYLNASVLPLGSSRIEWHASRLSGDPGPDELEKWRIRKEAGEDAGELRTARHLIGADLASESYHTLGVARRKLTEKRQFEEIRAIFGGGGHARNPYEKYLLSAFEDDTRPLHGRPFIPDVISLPTPNDLEPEEEIRRWMDRLWIAYGLSFFPGDYPKHKFPEEIPDSIPIIAAPRTHFVSKDMC